MSQPGLEYTTFRPSFVGRDGGALPTFIRQVKLSPVVTVIGTGLSALAADLGRGRGGDLRESRRPLRKPEPALRARRPRHRRWNGPSGTIARVLGKRRKLVHVPIGLAR